MSDKKFVTIIETIKSDGLDNPSVSIYFSGCDKKELTGSFCKGCHNKEMQDYDYGYPLDFEEILTITFNKALGLELLFGFKPTICFIGGEPLAAFNREWCVLLAKKFFEEEYETIVYTWRTEEMLKHENINTEYFSKMVLGEYIEELNNPNERLGSSNQYVYIQKEVGNDN